MATLGEVKSGKKTVDVVNVVTHGQDLIIPEGMTLERVDKVIHNKMAFDDTMVAISATVPGLVPDAAYAFFRAMERKNGWVNQIPTPGFFGATPPATITVEVDRGKNVQVPFGRFEIAGIEGYLESGVAEDPKRKGVAIFSIGGEVKRRYEKQITELVEMAQQIVINESIYKGKPWALRVRQDNGKPLPFPTPKFLDLNPSVEGELIFSDTVMRAVRRNLFTPIEHTEACRKHKIPLKRGVLLAGAFGVGKTMAAHAVAIKCVRNGWTYIVVEKADELAEVLRFAQEFYSPCVAFCEDIDRVMSGERDIDTDQILNIIDGVESKNAELMIVLTTNDIDHIEPALLRPGRLDAVIYVDKPDASAVERLARQYGRGLIADGEDISEASTLLAGRIPAVVREAVEHSKLAAIVHADDPLADDLKVTNAALLDAASEMQFQLDKLEPKVEDKRSETVKAAHVMAEAMKEVAQQGSVAAQAVVIPSPVAPPDAYRDNFARDDNGNIIQPE